MIRPKVHVIKRLYADGKRAYTVRWYDPRTGRYRSKKIGTDSLLAERERRRITHELERGGNGDPRLLSWSDFVAKFLENYRIEKAPTTVAVAEEALNTFGDLCHPAGPHAVTYEMILDFRHKLLTRPGKKRKTVKPITVNKKVKVLGGALREAKRMGYVEMLPDFKLFDIPKQTVNPLTVQERQKLFEVLPDAKWKAFVELALTTSGRKMDILSLRWEDVDFDDRGLLIHERKRRRRDLRPRWAAMTADAYGFLRDLYEAADKILLDGQHIPKVPWVFTTQRGTQWKWNTNRQWDKLLAKAGLKHHQIHDMRRTAPSDMERMRYGEKTKQAVTGHASGAVMRDHYIHVDRELIREAAEKVSDLKRA